MRAAALLVAAALAVPHAPTVLAVHGAHALPAAALNDAAADDVNFVAVTVNLGGELLDTRFHDLDGDGFDELLLAVRAQRAGEASRREIHIHRRGADGNFGMDPDQIVPVLDDVIVYGCADVRDEPGSELIFLTRTGAFSYSLTRDGYRNNIRRLLTADLLFQIPDERALPSWSYVLPRAGGDLLLLPGTERIALWGPRVPAAEGADDAAVQAGAAASAAAAGDFTRLGEWGDKSASALFSVKAPGALSVRSGNARVRIESGDSRDLFVGESATGFSALLEAEVRYRAPALADVNGDGLKDLVLHQDNALHVALGTADGFAPEWSRSEPLPAWLDKPDSDLKLLLTDLDGDGDADVLARSSPDDKRLDVAVFTYFVLINDGERLLPDQAQQVLRLEASGTRAEVTDVDDDGRPDLVLTKWTLPAVEDLVTGFKVQRGSFVHFARGSGSDPPFERKPSLRDEQSFTLESLQDMLVLRDLSADCSGDGIADLVELDLSGRVAIRRVVREKSFFGGDGWRIESEAWKRFDMGSKVERLLLQDLNGDGIADIIRPADRSLVLMLSRRAGAGR